YEDYRGKSGSAGERQWIDLDPSFKPHSFKPGLQVAGGLAFDFEDYVSRLRDRNPREFFEDSLWAFTKRAGILCNTLAEIPLRAEIRPLEGPYLPNGLRSTRISTLGIYRTSPDAYRKKVQFSLEDKNGNSLLSRTVTLAEAQYR